MARFVGALALLLLLPTAPVVLAGGAGCLASAAPGVGSPSGEPDAVRGILTRLVETSPTPCPRSEAFTSAAGPCRPDLAPSVPGASCGRTRWDDPLHEYLADCAATGDADIYVIGLDTDRDGSLTSFDAVAPFLVREGESVRLSHFANVPPNVIVLPASLDGRPRPLALSHVFCS